MLGRELRAVAHDHLFLAALETRQAGESLVSIIAMGLITACLLASAWLALISVAVLLLVQRSPVTASGALMLVFAAHCLLAALLVSIIRRRSTRLLFPATIRQLEPARRADPTAQGGSP